MRAPFLSLLITLGLSCAASSEGVHLQDQVEAETARREQQLQPLREAYDKSRKLVADGNGSQACDDLEQAYQNTPDALKKTPLGQQVEKTLSKLEATLAEGAGKKNHWPEARKRALASLRYDPTNEKALEELRQSDEVLRRGTVGGQEENPALSTSFFDRLNGVRSGLEEAQAFRETGQLDKAEQAYEDTLKIDPFNQVATDGIKKIYEERSLVAEKAKDVSNLERKREVVEAWNNIYPKASTKNGGIDAVGEAMTRSPSFSIENKMRTTIIPRIDFEGADLETIRRALITLSRQYDPEVSKGGVNFVVSSDITDASLVSLRLRQTSLAEVIKYVCQIAGIKSRVNEIGVTFSPLVETRPDLIPRDFKVSPSFFKGTSEISDISPLSAKYGSTNNTQRTAGAGQNEQQKLTSLGVVFPPGAYAVYNRSTSFLKVVNNAEMLDLISQLISASEEETLLIQVGVRLIEINQSDLDSVTVNSKFGTAALGVANPGGTGATPITPAGGTGVNGQLNQIQGVGLLQNNNLTSFLTPGVLAGTNSNASYKLNTMTLGGFLNTMQFSSLITAISQKSSANVLANPSIVLKRGNKGMISSIQEFKYVTEYNNPQSSIAQIIIPGGATVPGPETVIGSFPSSISDIVPIGVELGVEADVKGTSKVSMKLEPTFLDFEGNINYGTVINSSYASRPFFAPPATNAVPILTNIINQPVFIKRQVKLDYLEVADGYTILLGGLLREDIQTVDEKIPLLGDVPIFGRAFRGKTEQAVKKNTLIFVTPRILRVDGQPLNPTAGVPTTAANSDSL
jgi:general secretion pathway protein D